VFPFAEFHFNAGARYSTDILLIPDPSRANSDFHVDNNPSTCLLPPVFVASLILQSQSIQAPIPAVAGGAERFPGLILFQRLVTMHTQKVKLMEKGGQQSIAIFK
jgi:hypothetical protein